MRVKKVFTMCLISIFGAVTLTVSGCNVVTVSNNTDTTSQTTKTALPLLDTEVHSSLETAYFALG